MSCENTLNPRRGNDVLIKIGNAFDAKAVTFTATDDKVNFTAHGLSNGDAVAFSAVNTTTSIAANTVYFVINAATDDFELSSTDPNLPDGSTPVVVDVDGDGTSIEVFREIAALQSGSITIGSEVVDITNKNSNKWRELLSGEGIKSAEIAGSGFSVDDFSQGLMDKVALSGEIRKYRLYREGQVGAALDASGDDYFQMCAKVNNLSYAGEANQAQTIELALSSSGEVTLTEVA